MRALLVGGVLALSGMAFASQYLLTPPLATPDLPEGKGKVAERHFLSDTGEAGKRVFSGSCESCHGAEGLGGTGPRLDTKAFARDFLHSRDLHRAVSAPIPAHEELGVVLGPPGSKKRFNDVEKLAKYLRELRISRQNKDR